MKRSRSITFGLLAVVAVALLLLLAWSNRMFQAAHHQNSGTAVAAAPQHARLTTAEDDKILLGNIATVSLQELYHLLEQRTPNEMARLARQLQLLPTGGVSNAKITAFFKAWAALNPKAALITATTFETSSERGTAIEAVLDGCDPSAAGSIVTQLGALEENVVPTASKERLLNKGVVRWSQTDPAAATEFLAELYPNAAARFENPAGGPQSGYLMKTAGEVAENWGAADPQAALAWALSRSGEQRNMAFQSVLLGWWQKDPAAAQAYVTAHTDSLMGQQTAGMLASRIAARDPEAALTWAGQLPMETRARTISAIASGWAENDPQAASKWALTLPASQRSSAIQLVAFEWSLHDPQGAAQWVGSLTGELRDFAVGSYSSTVAATDPGAGLNWAMTISDPKRRAEVFQPIVNNWLTLNPAAAKAWIETSALSESEKTRLLRLLPAE